MASGHVKRANRPNTWLHRPSLRREVFPCQLRAVHTWAMSGLAGDMKLLPSWTKGDIQRAPYSITSSAIDDRPRAFAVLRLITNSDLVDCMTGSLAGFSDLGIRPM